MQSVLAPAGPARHCGVLLLPQCTQRRPSAALPAAAICEAASAARAAAEAEAQLEEVPLEQRLGPGGLDPVEVFESLPEPLQAAYEARDTDALRAFVGAMPTAEARVLMRRMVDSGLWVPEPGEEGTLLRGEEAAEGGA